MTTLLRTAAVLLATATAAVGLALPASAAPTAATAATAQAVAPRPCPRIVAVCAYTAAGALKLLFNDEPFIDPPIVWAANNTPDAWCFFSAPGFSGDSREVAPGETVENFGFDVLSARPDACM
ncbi:hypothetical protein AB0F17_35770 [Nonomuraea sp. NPDC026600]|uniref:hypothetical protein n=1 Tax=Nonomuraea sp. NPDC026600 TaxID=3155363 RepID=UPI0033D7A6DC